MAEEVVQPDAGAAPQPEEERVAGVAAEEEEVVGAQRDAAAVPRSEGALPSAAAWVFRQDRVRRRPAP